MSSLLKPPTADDAVRPSTSNRPSDWNDPPPRLERSPHPYRRKKRDYPIENPAFKKHSYLPSPAVTPYHSDSERPSSKLGDGTPRHGSPSPSESGTEADDEALGFTKALPAPPTRPRKGLRESLAPAAARSIQVSARTSRGSSPSGSATSLSNFSTSSKAQAKAREAEHAQRRGHGRRTKELVRRSSELVCLALIGYRVLRKWQRQEAPILVELSMPGLIAYATVLSALFAVYPLRLMWSCRRGGLAAKITSVGIPESFDPAPCLYPTLLPVLVALSLAPTFPGALRPNIVLSVSAMQTRLVPYAGTFDGPNTLHWLLSLLSVFDTPRMERLALLYPLHEALLPPLHYLTSSSLLPSELQLLSVALINLLVLAESPPMRILQLVMWIGGTGLFLLCARPLRWNVALERIPRWRFRRAGHVVRASQGFLSLISKKITGQGPPAAAMDSDADDDDNDDDNDRISLVNAVHESNGQAVEASKAGTQVPNGTISPARTASHASRHRRTRSSTVQAYLAMTPTQAKRKQWLYAAYTYLTAVVLILGPIRYLIGEQALNGVEPFCWAIGYLFGGMPAVSELTGSMECRNFLALFDSGHTSRNTVRLVERLDAEDLGEANRRVMLFCYWASVLAAGICTVLILSKSVEVDTRRKIFHGTMVAMLLPTAYMDPAFLSLGLVLVLAVFLLLELIRASQLKPLSRPLAAFLAPYVDGRDLRGPVVISHIFLLVGCAMPLWLSLAGSVEGEKEAREGPWKGWRGGTRDLSMVTGVLCVGLGDAAASLVGRRVGRHKWPWAGGKSLEGSMAFMMAVTVGLLVAKGWLRAGGWETTTATKSNGETWLASLGKACGAAAGASFTEAVLTGANDNIVPPIVLWLLVR